MAKRRHLPANDPRPSAWTYRRGERLFLVAIVVTVAAGMLAITLGSGRKLTDIGWLDALPLCLFAGGAAMTHLALVACGSRCDTRIPGLTLLLAGIGLILQTRLQGVPATTSFRPTDAALPLGMAFMVACTVLFRRGRWRLLAAMRWPAWAGSLAVLGAVFLVGHRFRGALFLPGNINPTEITKVLLVLFAAGYIHARQTAIQEGPILPLLNTSYYLFAFCWILPLGMLIALRDLGMVLILGLIGILMLWLATRRRILLFGMVATAAAAALPCLVFLPHARRRVDAWLNPFDDPTGAGWQVLQSLTAFYNGGMWGRGIGEGTPQLVPIAGSDFIYAAIGEELGFVGCLLIVALFFILVNRALRIGASQTELFPALVAAAYGGALGIQALINLGGVVKALPLTGVTLPFISHGGSSLLTSFIMAGLILAMSDTLESEGGSAARR